MRVCVKLKKSVSGEKLTLSILNAAKDLGYPTIVRENLGCVQLGSVTLIKKKRIIMRNKGSFLWRDTIATIDDLVEGEQKDSFYMDVSYYSTFTEQDYKNFLEKVSTRLDAYDKK